MSAKAKSPACKTNFPTAFQMTPIGCQELAMRCQSDRCSRTALCETRAFAADNLANLRREKENPGRLHRLAIGHHKKHRPARQVSPQGSSRPAAIRQPRIVGSSRSGAWATCRRLHPSSKSTEVFARRVTWQGEDPPRERPKRYAIFFAEKARPNSARGRIRPIGKAWLS